MIPSRKRRKVAVLVTPPTVLGSTASSSTAKSDTAGLSPLSETVTTAMPSSKRPPGKLVIVTETLRGRSSWRSFSGAVTRMRWNQVPGAKVTRLLTTTPASVFRLKPMSWSMFDPTWNWTGVFVVATKGSRKVNSPYKVALPSTALVFEAYTAARVSIR